MQGYELDQAGSGQGQVAGTSECGNEPSGSIKCGEFLDWLKTSQILKKNSALWSMEYCIRLMTVFRRLMVNSVIVMGPSVRR